MIIIVVILLNCVLNKKDRKLTIFNNLFFQLNRNYIIKKLKLNKLFFICFYIFKKFYKKPTI